MTRAEILAPMLRPRTGLAGREWNGMPRSGTSRASKPSPPANDTWHPRRVSSSPTARAGKT